MQSQATYLKSGFFVSLGVHGPTLQFTQFSGQGRRALPWRVELIERFGDGYHGQLEDLVQELAQRFEAKAPAIRTFIRNLESAGFLTPDAPNSPSSEEARSSSVDVGVDEVTLPTPITLLSEAGKFLWHDHDGKLLIRLGLREVVVHGHGLVRREAHQQIHDLAVLIDVAEAELEVFDTGERLPVDLMIVEAEWHVCRGAVGSHC